jgi:hypothetical protein
MCNHEDFPCCGCDRDEIMTPEQIQDMEDDFYYDMDEDHWDDEDVLDQQDSFDEDDDWDNVDDWDEDRDNLEDDDGEMDWYYYPQ